MGLLALALPAVLAMSPLGRCEDSATGIGLDWVGFEFHYIFTFVSV